MEKEKHLRDVDLAAGAAALVVVDMENEFCKPEGKYYLGPAVEPVIRRDGGTFGSLPRGGASGSSSSAPSATLPTRVHPLRHGAFLIEGTNGPVIVPELKPLAGEPVVEKHSHDCFYRTEDGCGAPADGHRVHRRTGVIVTGVMSNICVYHAVLDSTYATSTPSCRWIARSALRTRRISSSPSSPTLPTSTTYG